MTDLGKAQLHQLYRTMRLIRRFEERAIELSDAGEIPGSIHLCLGQEAVAAGVCSAIRRDDLVASTHRGHGHLIAKGADINRMMAELMARSTGLNRGRGGSMHVADFGIGFLGTNGIVAAGVPWAVGAAWVARRRGDDTIAVAFFGDGAINQGVLHESMNLAVIWHAPVVFCCENNQYAVTMPIDRASALPLSERASSYGMPVTSVDGMDPVAVYDAMVAAAGRARSTGDPVFLECRAYRYSGHFAGERTLNLDPYRTEEEMAMWHARDPVKTFPDRLQRDGVMTKDELAQIDAEIEETLAEAVEFGRASPSPAPEEALDLVYAQGQTERFPNRGWVEP